MKNKTLKVVGIVIGVLTVILGVYAMLNPGWTFLSLGWMLGILLLSSGLQMLIAGIQAEKKDIPGCVLGIISIIGGVILLFNGLQRLLADKMIIWLIAICLICSGIFQIINGIQSRKQEGKGGILAVILGVLSVIVGILAFGHPVITAISTGYIIAWSIIMQGIDVILSA